MWEVSLFQGENKCEVGTQSSVLINQAVFISEVSFKRNSTVSVLSTYMHSHTLSPPSSP